MDQTLNSVEPLDSEIRKTGGTFASWKRPLLFTASTLGDCQHEFISEEDARKKPLLFSASTSLMNVEVADLTRYILIAVTDLKSEESLERLDSLFTAGREILIDSGIFVLTNEHMRAHGCTMDVALALAPNEIDGFDKLLECYLQVIARFGDKSWGYVEMDQGGRDNKIKTREMLEGYGLCPIPVYHPINDGWDYFDYLAKRYDRICIGNIVQAPNDLRVRIMATICERKLDYPDLWIHALGVSTVPILFSLPFDSADASKWLEPTRWPTFNTLGCMARAGKLGREYFYNRECEPDHPKGRNGLVKILGWDVVCHNIMWNHHRQRIKQEMGLPRA